MNRNLTYICPNEEQESHEKSIQEAINELYRMFSTSTIFNYQTGKWEQDIKLRKQWECPCGDRKLYAMMNPHFISAIVPQSWYCFSCKTLRSKSDVQNVLNKIYSPITNTGPLDDEYFCKDPKCATCDEMGRHKLPRKEVTSPTEEVCTCPIIGLGILHVTGCIDSPNKGAYSEGNGG